MKNIIVAGLFFLTLLSCNQAGDTLSSTEYITISPRIARTQSVTDSVWNLAASVHIKLSSTNGSSLFEDTILFSKRQSPSIVAPSDQGVNVLVEGLSNTNAIVWSGNIILPPSIRDTAFAVNVSAVNAANGSSASLGTVNSPLQDSTSVKSWGIDTFDQPVHIYLSSPTPNAIIRYTTDGTYPTSQSPLYSNTGIMVDSNCTINAFGMLAGWTNSALFSRKITIQARPARIASYSPNQWAVDTFDAPVTIKIVSETPNAEVRYTLDGTNPNRSSLLTQTGEIVIDSSRTIKAIIYAAKAQPSSTILTQKFTLKMRDISYGGSLDGWRPYTIEISNPSPQAVIHYTTDGTDPDSKSSIYTKSIELLDSITIKSRAYYPTTENVIPSSIISRTYGFAVIWNKGVQYGRLLDARDSQEYRTVTIGNQTWMAENLNYTSQGSVCFSNDTMNCRKLGRLYTWMGAINVDTLYSNSVLGDAESVSRQGVCPTGWHVPRKSEWHQLTSVTLDSNTSATMLKSVRGWGVNYQWGSAYTEDMIRASFGSDDYGFRVLPSGLGSLYGGKLSSSTDSGSLAFYWTASESQSALSPMNYAESIQFQASHAPKVSAGGYGKTMGMAMRCIKN